MLLMGRASGYRVVTSITVRRYLLPAEDGARGPQINYHPGKGGFHCGNGHQGGHGDDMVRLAHYLTSVAFLYEHSHLPRHTRPPKVIHESLHRLPYPEVTHESPLVSQPDQGFSILARDHKLRRAVCPFLRLCVSLRPLPLQDPMSNNKLFSPILLIYPGKQGHECAVPPLFLSQHTRGY